MRPSWHRRRVGQLALAACFATLLAPQAIGEGVAYRQAARLDLTKIGETRSPWSVAVYESKPFNKALDALQAGGPVENMDAVFDQPAHVCFIHRTLASKHCLETRTSPKAGGSGDAEQSLVQLSAVALAGGDDPVRGVLVSTREYAETLGQIGVRIWRYSPKADRFDLSVSLALSDVSEIRFYQNGAGHAFLITADMNYADGSGARDEPQPFLITVRQLQANGRYGQLLHYVTRAKYPTMTDHQFRAELIAQELPVIERRVAARIAGPKATGGASPWRELPRLSLP